MADAEELLDAGEHKLYLLDVGKEKYGDAILCVMGAKRILIDGAHPGDEAGSAGDPSIPEQLEEILGPPPFKVDLLVVTHCHSDHIGCLPALVLGGTLKTRWALLADPALGYGEVTGDPAPDADPDADDATLDAPRRRLAAALREESRADVDDASLEAVLDAAGGLRGQYEKMIARLRDDIGDRLVFYDGKGGHAVVEEAFKSLKLRVLGPTREHLEACEAVIAEAIQARPDVVDDFVGTDAPLSEVDAYRQLAGALTLDASSEGAAINSQSIILTLEHGPHRVLLTGDMQFAGGVSEVNDEMAALREKVRGLAPYAFVKLAHHAAANGVSAKTVGDYGETPNFGISTGLTGTDHPNPKVLTLLKSLSQQRDILVSRTDRNGRVTVDLDADPPTMEPSRGRLNDFRPKRKPTGRPDRPGEPQGGEAGRRGEPARQPVLRQGGAPAVLGPPPGDMVTVIAHVPHRKTTVRLDVTVDPADAGEGAPRRRAERPPAPRDEGDASDEERGDAEGGGDDAALPSFPLAAGQDVPKLLFATHVGRLRDRVGTTEADHALAELRRLGHAVVDDVPGGGDAAAAARHVRDATAAAGDVNGVVLLGGYDVVPSLRVDVVDESIRDDVNLAGDPDRFVVWSDDVYADSDGDLLPELPVSRIPDGKSSKLLFAALAPRRDRRAGTKSGVRNVERPFADKVWRVINGAGTLHQSEPAVFDQQPRMNLAADTVYLMLHGYSNDGTRFSGERTEANKEAVNLGLVPETTASVVLCGCCWGALPVGVTGFAAGAGGAGTTAVLRPRSADSSIALRFLGAGATAFVGCTGAHWSPNKGPEQGAGGPMHLAFIRHLQGGAAPALALMRAKMDYADGIPHDLDGADGLAIELKTLAQFTCLGLGW